MIDRVVSFGFALMGACCVLANETVPLEGTVAETSVVSVPLRPWLATQVTRGRPDALAAELRVVDGKGADVPYVLRPMRARVENAQGEVETKTIRQSVSTRPFRIDRLRLAESVCKTSFTPAPPWEVHWAAEVEHEAKAKLTTLTFNAYGLPVTAVGVRTSDSNFSRSVRVLARRNNGWHPLAEGRISAFDLPGKQARNLEIPLRSEAAEDTLRLEIRDGDNPLLNFEHLQATAKVTAYEIVFVAKPGEKYALEVRHGAARPCYDSVVGDYIANVQDPVRWDVKMTDAWGDADGPTAVWLVWNPIPCVTAVVFMLLLGVCFWLFRSAK